MRTRALSAMPHRLTAVIKIRPVRQIASRWWPSEGNAEARLAAPAARLTVAPRSFLPTAIPAAASTRTMASGAYATELSASSDSAASPSKLVR